MEEKQQGFTLMEVVIAVAIAAFVMTAVYGVFSSTSRARTKADESSGHIHQARVFFDRISRELRGSNWSASDATTSFVVKSEDDGFKEMVFSSSAAVALRSAQAEGATIRYILEKDSGELRTLYRITSSGTGAEVGEPGRYTILSDVAEMEMRFYHKGAWFEKWNSEDEKQLPRLVEITLKIQSEGRDLPFSTTVDIPLSGG